MLLIVSITAPEALHEKVKDPKDKRKQVEIKQYRLPTNFIIQVTEVTFFAILSYLVNLSFNSSVVNLIQAVGLSISLNYFILVNQDFF